MRIEFWLTFALLLANGKSNSQLTYNQPFALRINGLYLEYKEREYGINLSWSNYPVYQWEFRKANTSGNIQNNRNLGLYNNQIRDYVVYESREYGINLKWLKDTRQNNFETWIVEGLNPGNIENDLIKLKNTSQSVQSKPYLVYGEREYGVNLVWGSRPASDNITLLITGSRTTRMDNIPNSSNQQLALREQALIQNDILGSDYAGIVFIGMAPAERYHLTSPNKNVWFPVDGYKKTFCGIIDDYFVFDGKPAPFSDNDDDMNLNLVPQPNSIFQTMLRNMWPIAGRKKADALGIPGNRQIIESISFGHVQAEIDVEDNTFKNHIYPGKNTAPKKTDYLCAFGPYVMDKDHGYKPEIHPAEQLWWKKANGRNAVYYLTAMCDVSDRFDDKHNFDTDDGQISFSKPWAEQPLRVTFAIFFEVEKGNETIEYRLAKIAETNSFPITIQPKNSHYLVSGRDTILTVKELHGLDLNIRFESVSRNPNTSKIQGFIVLKTKLGVQDLNRPGIDTDQGGGLVLKVDKIVKQ